MTLVLPPELEPKNPPADSPYPPILEIALLLMISGNTMKIPSAAANPQGNGRIICKPMLIANDAKRKIRYVLKLNNSMKLLLKTL